jgi:hypothetical protein
MHRWILLAIVFAVQNVSVLSQENRPDLGRIAGDDHALASVEILYRVEGQFVTFHGDGRVLTQSTIPERHLLPTCKGRIPTEDVRRLLETMMATHFLDLPQKSYMIVNGDEGDWRKLQLHSISIKTAGGNASRTFSAGSMAVYVRNSLQTLRQ